MITLYTIDCPKCKVLELKLNAKNIDYKTVKDVTVMKELGIMSLPVLGVENDLLSFTDAVKFINEVK